jgi:hypothetical protein
MTVPLDHTQHGYATKCAGCCRNEIEQRHCAAPRQCHGVFRKEAEEERNSWRQAYENAQKEGKVLDITLADKNRDAWGAYAGKTMWMIERLELWYGADFMPRFLEISHALKGLDQRPAIQEVLYYFSLAAGQDLSKGVKGVGSLCIDTRRRRSEPRSDWACNRRCVRAVAPGQRNASRNNDSRHRLLFPPDRSARLSPLFLREIWPLRR